MEQRSVGFDLGLDVLGVGRVIRIKHKHLYVQYPEAC